MVHTPKLQNHCEAQSFSTAKCENRKKKEKHGKIIMCLQYYHEAIALQGLT